jgi:hypothetical protein
MDFHYAIENNLASKPALFNCRDVTQIYSSDKSRLG